MDKNAIKKFAVWARRELIERVSQKEMQYGIEKGNIVDAAADSINGKVLTDTQKNQRRALISQINAKGYEEVMEEVAYTWFNRLIALRFMEVNGYLPTRVRVFTDEENNFRPQIIDEALHLDLDGLNMEKVYEFKNTNQTEELYKYLLITQCNALNSILPGMFQRISDYTELLLPDNLLRDGSVIEQMISTIPEEDWQDAVQIIGWLYQYYNAEKKDEVFAALKKNVKITKENIPAATQLFTPDWIVRYMVENSLGRLWVEGHPNDELKSGWKYYLEEAEQEPEVQAQLAEIRKEYAAMTPEQIKCIDPCCGSGHILAYLFDVLVQIYESYGYTTREAAESIVKNNLYGLDIDDRAAQLAYFSVMMKARQYDRRFFSRKIQPNVYAIQESNGVDRYALDYFCNGDAKLKAAMDSIIKEMHDAKEYGSILNITPVDFAALYARFDEVRDDISMSKESVLNSLLPLVQVAEALDRKYDVVVTNPPYMGSSNMSARLAEYIKENFQNGKTDLFAAFIYRCYVMTGKNGFIAMITQHGWMFLSSYEKMRQDLMQCANLVNMAHLGARAFDEISGEVVQTTSFVFRHRVNDRYFSRFERLIEGTSEAEKESLFLKQRNIEYFMQAETIKSIPNHLFAYWLDRVLIDHLVNDKKAGDFGDAKQGLITSDNDRFLRFWYEIDPQKIGTKWYMYNKGGGFRRWYGNILYVVNWENDGFEICHFVDDKGKLKSRPQNIQYFFKEGLTWNDVSTAKFCCRYVDNTCAFDASGPMFFLRNNDNLLYFLGLLNSSITQEFMNLICQGLHYSTGHIPQVPVKLEHKEEVEQLVSENIAIVKEDWDSFETSSEFTKHPLI
ncbi:BREX-1 system adenine-specific DNA-methyltransferase PglX [Mordavella massiliensis]|nr:BREX-1 system adenine-specific DNA-methyltransferase PglX [Mordavella massiliensis]